MHSFRAALLGAVLSVVWGHCASATAQPWIVHEVRNNVEMFAEMPLETGLLFHQFSQVQLELDSLLQLKRDPRNVQVIVFSSQARYRNYLGQKIPQALQRRAIFYKSGDVYQVYTFRHQDLLTDLRHEYTHALLHQSLPFIPLWIDEGLAEVMEERPEERAGSARQSAMKWRCRTGWKPDLRELEKIPSAAHMTQDHYRDSWAWVSYLLNDSEQSRSLFRTYLQAISAGEAPGDFSAWLQSRDAEVAKRIGSYFRRFGISLR